MCNFSFPCFHQDYSLAWTRNNRYVLVYRWTYENRLGSVLSRLKKIPSKIISMKSIVLLLITVTTCTLAYPFNEYLSLVEDLDDDNYDIIIDQRQNGTQNFRVRVNGVSIAIPDEQPDDSGSLTEFEIASLLGGGHGSTEPTTGESSDDEKNDFSDLAAFFDLKKGVKKQGNKKELDDTQSRTKDLPTNSQIMGDTKDTVKAYVKNNGRKYKLLVGEKYIIPILQYLKKHLPSAE